MHNKPYEVDYPNGLSKWHSELDAWVGSIMSSTINFGKDNPKASAKAVERKDGKVQFELTVEWYDPDTRKVFFDYHTRTQSDAASENDEIGH